MTACGKASVLVCLALSTLPGCVTGPKTERGGLDESQIAARLPDGVQDPGGWARDIRAAITAVPEEPTAERVCAVVAVIEQESRFRADPAVPELPKIVRTE